MNGIVGCNSIRACFNLSDSLTLQVHIICVFFIFIAVICMSFGCWTDSGESAPIEPIPEYIPHEFENNNKWHIVRINDRTYRIDMESIDPYKKVLSHGGEICYMMIFVISKDLMWLFSEFCQLWLRKLFVFNHNLTVLCRLQYVCDLAV